MEDPAHFKHRRFMRALMLPALFAFSLSAQSLKPKPHVPLKGSEAAASYVEGGVAFRAKDWDTAVAAYESALEKDPEFAGAALLAGDARYEQQRFQEAEALFAQASRIDPLMAKAHEHRALALTRLRRLDEAMDETYAALDIDPGYAHAWEDLGNLRKAKGLAPLEHLDLWNTINASNNFEEDLAANVRLAKGASSPSRIRLKALSRRGLLKEVTFILAPKFHHWPAWEAYRKANPGALRRFIEQQRLRPSEAALSISTLPLANVKGT